MCLRGNQFRVLSGEDYSRYLHHKHLEAIPLKERWDAQTLGRMTGDREAVTLESGWVSGEWPHLSIWVEVALQDTSLPQRLRLAPCRTLEVLENLAMLYFGWFGHN